jgi:hypothetical protein
VQLLPHQRVADLQHQHGLRQRGGQRARVRRARLSTPPSAAGLRVTVTSAASSACTSWRARARARRPGAKGSEFEYNCGMNLGCALALTAGASANHWPRKPRTLVFIDARRCRRSYIHRWTVGGSRGPIPHVAAGHFLRHLLLAKVSFHSFNVRL